MRRPIVVLALFPALIVTACSGQQSGAPAPATTGTTATSAAPDRNKVEFVDDICGAVAKFVVPSAGYRPDTSSATAAVASYKTQLSKVSAGLTEAIEDLKDVHTTGIQDGPATVDAVRSTFGGMKQTVDAAKTKLDAVDLNNQQAAATAIQEVNKNLAALGAGKNPLAEPALSTPEMEAAAAQSQECQKIKDVVANRTSGSAAPTT